MMIVNLFFIIYFVFFNDYDNLHPGAKANFYLHHYDKFIDIYHCDNDENDDDYVNDDFDCYDYYYYDNDFLLL